MRELTRMSIWSCRLWLNFNFETRFKFRFFLFFFLFVMPSVFTLFCIIFSFSAGRRSEHVFAVSRAADADTAARGTAAASRPPANGALAGLPNDLKPRRPNDARSAPTGHPANGSRYPYGPRHPANVSGDATNVPRNATNGSEHASNVSGYTANGPRNASNGNECASNGFT